MIDDTEAIYDQEFVIRLHPELEGDVVHTLALSSMDLKVKWLERLQHRKIEQEEHRMRMEEEDENATGDELEDDSLGDDSDVDAKATVYAPASPSEIAYRREKFKSSSKGKGGVACHPSCMVQ